jgi:hypothetical protein
MTRLQAFGIDLDLPAGWDGRIFRRVADRVAFTGAVAHAGTFPLPSDRGDFGSGAVEVMGPSDVLVVLFEYGPASANTPLFASVGRPGPLAPDDFSPNALQRRIPSQAGVQRFFTLDGRAFCMYVVIGRHGDRMRLAGRANELLAGLRISGH